MTIAFLFALTIAGAAQPAPTPASTTTPVPSTSPSPAPSTSPSAPAGPTAPPVYNFVYKPTPSPVTTPFPELGSPEILEIDVTDQTIAAPGPLHVRVVTNDDTISVVAESFGYEFTLPKTGRGLFTIDTTIPPVPDNVKGKQFNVNVTATSKNGRVSSLTLPFMLK
jgi:hypothetical protein